MSEVAARIDDFGSPAWIALMTIGFMVFWPLGLAILLYVMLSGRMWCRKCGETARWQRRTAERRRRRDWRTRHWGSHGWLHPSDNGDFAEYRYETLCQLENDAQEFHAFLRRLRMAKDRAEFDEVMRDRRKPHAAPGKDPPGGSPPEGSQV